MAAGIESDGYRKWPRVQETILFAKRMGYHKIGIATCVALLRESRILAKMLRANGFEVFGVGCKTGEIFKTELGIDQAHQGPGPVACNPVLQAQLLNEAGTELNIVMGLCVGHDSLFYKHAKAVTTTLVVKDRVLVHNPVMALYTAEGYYANLMRLWKTNESSRPSGAGFFPSGAHRLCLGWWVWNKNFPWNRAGSSAGRPAGGPSSPWRSPAGAGTLPGVCPGGAGPDGPGHPSA